MNNTTKDILKSTGPLFVVIVLFVFVGNYGFGRISDIRSQISTAQSDKTVLTQKLDTLRTVNQIASSGSVAASNALPSKNPELIVLSQVKSIAAQDVVSLGNLKTGSENKDNSGLSKVDIGFEATGPKDAVLAFIDGIEKAAPIALVDQIKLSETADVVRATITVSSFWAPLPQKLPALNQPINDLTVDEKNVLGQINKLTQPQFVEVPPSGNGGRPNPFVQ